MGLLLVPCLPAVAGVDAIEVEVIIEPSAGTIDAKARLTVTQPAR